MKRIIFLALFAFSFMISQAQFGIKAGLNVASLGGDDVEDLAPGKSSVLGFHAGGYYHLKFADMFSIQPEAVYSSQGVQWESGGEEVKFTTGYILM